MEGIMASHQIGNLVWVKHSAHTNWAVVGNTGMIVDGFKAVCACVCERDWREISKSVM